MGLLAHHRDAMGAVAQRAEPGDMVGVQMRIHGLDQLEVELAHELKIAVDPLQHRIDDQRLAAVAAGEQIGVGAGRGVEQLAKDHRAPSDRPIRCADLTRDSRAGSAAFRFEISLGRSRDFSLARPRAGSAAAPIRRCS